MVAAFVEVTAGVPLVAALDDWFPDLDGSGELAEAMNIPVADWLALRGIVEEFEVPGVAVVPLNLFKSWSSCLTKSSGTSCHRSSPQPCKN